MRRSALRTWLREERAAEHYRWLMCRPINPEPDPKKWRYIGTTAHTRTRWYMPIEDLHPSPL